MLSSGILRHLISLKISTRIYGVTTQKTENLQYHRNISSFRQVFCMVLSTSLCSLLQVILNSANVFHFKSIAARYVV
jgi:hypothetical protein